MIAALLGATASLVLSGFRLAKSAVLSCVYGLVIGAAIAGVQAQTIADVAGPVGAGPTYSLPVAVCLALGAAVLGASLHPLSANGPGPRIAALVALGSCAAAFMTAVTDLLLLFIAVETLALCGYGIVAIAATNRARESAMKWFVQGSVATVVFIAGLAVLLLQTGGTLAYATLAELAAAPASSVTLAVGFALVLAALAFKAGAFPFHSWMPDAFETGPAPGIAMLASVGKVAPLTAAAYLVATISGVTGDRLAPVLAVLAVSSIVFGNLAALRQGSLARMLAYSGVAQVGYGFVGLVLGIDALTVLVFAALYGITSAASFLFVVALGAAEPEWDGSIAALSGLSRRRPALAIALGVIMFSLTGMPFTAGFWGKFVVIAAAASSGWLWLAVVAMLGSVVSFGYYGGVLRSAFMGEGEAAGVIPDETAEQDAVPGLEAVADHAEAGESAQSGDGAPVVWPSSTTVATVLFAALIVVIGVAPFLSGASTMALFLP
jgi:NADH-quinone oxidoreductase subunit N